MTHETLPSGGTERESPRAHGTGLRGGCSIGSTGYGGQSGVQVVAAIYEGTLWPVIVLVSLGILVGTLTIVSPLLVAVVVVVIALGLLLLRTPDVGALFVGSYWLAFAVKSTVFSQTNIAGLFFPFYGALLLTTAVGLLRSGLRVSPTLFWSIYAFLSVVAISFIGFDQSIDSQVTQKLMAMLVGVLVLLNFRSSGGLSKVPWFAGIAGLVISGWVIYNSVIGGFRYRGDVDANENVAAFILGASFLVVMAVFFSRGFGRVLLSRSLLLIIAGTMAYALLLLASRGMSIALAVAVVFMFIHLAGWHRQAMRLFMILLLVMSLGFILPGGSGLLQRFSGESVDSAGDRLPIWTATVEATVDSNVYQLLLGHGFNRSQVLIREATAVHTSTHNAYLAVTYEYGLLGLITFVGLHVGVLLLAFRLRSIYATLAAGFIGFLLAANMTSTAPDDFMYWLILGFAMACASFEGSRPRSHSHDDNPVTYGVPSVR